MTEEEKFRRIDDYVNGNLPAAEQAVFRQQLRDDPQLAEEVELHRDLLTGFDRAIRQEVDGERKAHLGQLERQAARRKRQTTLLVWLTGIAACLVLAITLALPGGDKYNKLFSHHYQPYMAAATERGRTARDVWEEALQAYEEGAYGQAATLLRPCLAATPPDAGCHFYAGLSAIELDRFTEARKYLRRVVDLPPNDYTGRARWYLALVYLKLDNPEESKRLLQTLRAEGGFYGRKAGMLLKEL